MSIDKAEWRQGVLDAAKLYGYAVGERKSAVVVSGAFDSLKFALDQLEAACGVPGGWRAVPEEPAWEMVEKALLYLDNNEFANLFRDRRADVLKMALAIAIAAAPVVVGLETETRRRMREFSNYLKSNPDALDLFFRRVGIQAIMAAADEHFEKKRTGEL